MAKKTFGTSKGSPPPNDQTKKYSVVAQGPVMTEEDKLANQELLDQYLYFKKMEKYYAPLKYTDTHFYNLVKEYIIGHDQAIKTLVYLVYHNMHQNMMFDYHDIAPQLYSAILIGPTGCGKTATLTKIFELFGIPFVKYNATPLTSSGFSGKDVENILELLIDAAHGDIQLAQYGGIYLDEVDKKRYTEPNNTSGKDVTGLSVQEELLKLLEPSTVDLGHGRTFDTGHLTVLMSGRFVGIEDIKTKRIFGKSSIGFGDSKGPAKNIEVEDIESYNEFDDSKSDNYTHQDVIEFGFLDEFVGRITDVIEFSALSRDNLLDIIFAKGSPLQKFVESIKVKGQELYIDQQIYERMVDAALNSQRGVRCLENSMRKFLIPADRDFMLNYRPGIMEYDEDGNYTSIFESPVKGKYIYNYIESKRSKIKKKLNNFSLRSETESQKASRM